MIEAPGIYDDIDEATYHSDPCVSPSASASILHKIDSRSPLHAWHSHPKLNPGWRPSKSTTAQAFGKAAHALLMGNCEVVSIDAADWRSKDAKAARIEAEEIGKVALLDKDLVVAKNMVHVLRSGLKSHRIGDVFSNGQPEVTIAWQDEGAWLRGRLDWWKASEGLIVDYKTTEGSADPDQWSRNLFMFGSDFQSVLYPEGIAALTGEKPRLIYVVQEVDPPHGFTVIELNKHDGTLDFSTTRVVEAFATWRNCLQTNRWPGYPSEICHVSAPVWALKREEARALATSASREIIVDAA